MKLLPILLSTLIPHLSHAIPMEFSESIEDILLPYVEEHSPDEEAEIISRYREEQLNYEIALERTKLYDTARFTTLFMQAVRSCRYISSISTPPPSRKVVLTFDDGPDPFGTPFILNVLSKYRLKATFFVKGNSANAHPDLIKRIVDDGHMIIANHSWTHRNFHELSFAEQKKEIAKTRGFLTRYQNQRYFRYPYGNSTCESKDFAHSIGYKLVGWHIDSCDWGFNKTGTVSSRNARICGVSSQNVSNFVAHVLQKVHRHNGGIILFHDVQPNTIQKVDNIIEELVRDGFEFTSLADSSFESSMR